MAGLQYDKVVVPVDFSDQSIRAVDSALTIAGDPTGVHILHIIEDLTPAHPGELYGTIDNETRSRHATEALQKQFGKDTDLGARRTDFGDAPADQPVPTEAMIEKEPITVVLSKMGWIRAMKGHLEKDAEVKFKEGELVRQMPAEDFDLVISINLKGVFNCTQAVVPAMIRQGGGVILNATSIVGIDGNIGQTNYIATKAGVIGMTKAWARELGRHNIRVNAVAPGFTATEILTSMPAKVLDGMKARTPLGRLGQPEDIANAYLFLASDEASFISGDVLRVDGGIVIGT